MLRRIAASRLTLGAWVGLGLGYLVVAGAVLYSGLPWSLTAFGASLVGIPLGVLLAVRCAGTRVGTALAWVGQRTLRVYVLHLIVLVALVQLPLALGERGVLGFTAAVGYPLAMSGLVVVACFAVHQVLVRLGGRWLFELPVGWDQRLVAAGAPLETGQPAPACGEPAEPSEPWEPWEKVPSVARSGITE